MLNSNPTLVRATILAEPPELIRGRATPVKGINPVTTAMLARA
jgi:hypothetical protein